MCVCVCKAHGEGSAVCKDFAVDNDKSQPRGDDFSHFPRTEADGLFLPGAPSCSDERDTNAAIKKKRTL